MWQIGQSVFLRRTYFPSNSNFVRYKFVRLLDKQNLVLCLSQVRFRRSPPHHSSNGLHPSLLNDAWIPSLQSLHTSALRSFGLDSSTSSEVVSLVVKYYILLLDRIVVRFGTKLIYKCLSTEVPVKFKLSATGTRSKRRYENHQLHTVSKSTGVRWIMCSLVSHLQLCLNLNLLQSKCTIDFHPVSHWQEESLPTTRFCWNSAYRELSERLWYYLEFQNYVTALLMPSATKSSTFKGSQQPTTELAAPIMSLSSRLPNISILLLGSLLDSHWLLYCTAWLPSPRLLFTATSRCNFPHMNKIAAKENLSYSYLCSDPLLPMMLSTVDEQAYHYLHATLFPGHVPVLKESTKTFTSSLLEIKFTVIALTNIVASLELNLCITPTGPSCRQR